MDFEKISSILERYLTPDLIQNLSLFAFRLAQKHSWWGKPGITETNPTTNLPFLTLPGGETTDSLIPRLIDKILDGSNVWDPDSVPLEVFLKQNIRREIGHLSNSKENRATKRLDEESEHYDPALRHNMNPREILISEEAEAQDRQFLNAFYDHLIENDEEEAIKVIDLLMDGYKPSEIEKLLGMKIKEIYNLKKRLKRQFKFFREEYYARQKL